MHIFHFFLSFSLDSVDCISVEISVDLSVILNPIFVIAILEHIIFIENKYVF